MINAQSLAVLLRALRQGEASPRSLPATAVVSRTMPVLALSTEDGHSPNLRAAADSLPHAPAHGEPAKVPARADPPVHELERRPPDLARRAPDLPRNAPTARTELRGPPAQGPVLVASANASATISFSSAASLVSEALRGPASDLPAPVQARAPLALVPPRQGEPLARALETAVARSGLFYESHVALWVADRYPIAALREEPKAQWVRASDLPPETPGVPSGSGAVVQSSEESLVLLRQQLDALEGRQFAIRAEAWPGQTVLLQFQEEPAPGQERRRREVVPVETTWRSRLTLTLPSLGNVEAVLAVDEDRVHVFLSAERADAQARLAQAQAELKAALVAAGLGSVECEVGRVA